MRRSGIVYPAKVCKQLQDGLITMVASCWKHKEHARVTFISSLQINLPHTTLTSCSLRSDFLRPHGLGLARLFCPWDSPENSLALVSLYRSTLSS
ncbi:hypothetical protein CapIbe_018509 [Capra ibex]